MIPVGDATEIFFPELQQTQEEMAEEMKAYEDWLDHKTAEMGTLQGEMFDRFNG